MLHVTDRAGEFTFIMRADGKYSIEQYTSLWMNDKEIRKHGVPATVVFALASSLGHARDVIERLMSPPPEKPGAVARKKKLTKSKRMTRKIARLVNEIADLKQKLNQQNVDMSI